MFRLTLLILNLLLPITASAFVNNTKAGPYASYNGGTLTFYYDGKWTSRSGKTYDLNEGIAQPGWLEHKKDITTVVFDASFANVLPTTTFYWFNGLKNLTEVQGLSNLDTSEVTNMNGMFSGCSRLNSLDLSSFNTAKVTDMAGMFDGCSSLTSLNVNSFNTANVTGMSFMFCSCSMLTSLDLSSFNTAKVTDMFCMFTGCSSLTSLDLSHFNTACVTNMAGMFRNCKSLTNINVSGFDTKKVSTMDCMFNGCRKLTSLDLSNFDTNALVDTNAGTYIVGDYAIDNLLSNCRSLSKLTLGSNFVTTDELRCNAVFAHCKRLKNVTFTGNIPSSINRTFFKGIGTANVRATLAVPKQYKENYAAKLDGKKFYGGFFRLGKAQL